MRAGLGLRLQHMDSRKQIKDHARAPRGQVKNELVHPACYGYHLKSAVETSATVNPAFTGYHILRGPVRNDQKRADLMFTQDKNDKYCPSIPYKCSCVNLISTMTLTLGPLPNPKHDSCTSLAVNYTLPHNASQDRRLARYAWLASQAALFVGSSRRISSRLTMRLSENSDCKGELVTSTTNALQCTQT